MKRISLILIALFVSILGYAQTFNLGGTTYEVISGTNTVNVTAYNTAAGSVVNIPATVLYSPPGERGINYSVVGIEPFAFTNKGLTSLSLPEGLLNIGHTAFFGNSLTSVIIPNSVNTIEYSAFMDNNISSLDLGTGVNEIQTRVFENNSITSVVIPGSVQTLGGNAFKDNSIYRVTVESGVGSIGINAFQNNPVISVTCEGVIPPSLASSAFANKNRDVIDLYIPDGAKPAYVTNSGAEWTGFKSVAEASFVIDYITYEVTSPSTVSAVNYNTQGGPAVAIPAMITVAGTTYDVTDVGEEAFFDNALTSLTLSEGLGSIQSRAFNGNSLTSLVVPNSVTYIAYNVFANNQLESLDLGTGIQTIANGSFSLNQLTNITIPGSMVAMGGNVFFGNNITKVIVEDGVGQLGFTTFVSNPVDTVISLGSTPPTLNMGTFADRSQIDLIIPGGTEDVYVTNPGAEWTGFKSVTEDITVGVSGYQLAHSVSLSVKGNSLDVISSNDIHLTNYAILNINGMNIKEGVFQSNSVDVSALSSGHYVLVLSSDKGEVVKRFFK